MKVGKYANMNIIDSFFYITASDHRIGTFFHIHIKNLRSTKYNNVIQKELHLITKKTKVF